MHARRPTIQIGLNICHRTLDQVARRVGECQQRLSSRKRHRDDMREGRVRGGYLPLSYVLATSRTPIIRNTRWPKKQAPAWFLKKLHARIKMCQ